MLGSLLMLGSTNNKLKKVNYIFAIMWIIYMLSNANLESGMLFVIANIFAFGVVFVLSKLLKGKYSNMVLSVCSILIWSVLIDIITFFAYPEFATGHNIAGYIFNGILFNLKFVFTNCIVMVACSLVKNFSVKIAMKSKKI